MPDEIATGGAIDRNQDERNDDNGQNHVCDQNCEVKGSDDSLPEETRIAMIIVVRQI